MHDEIFSLDAKAERDDIVIGYTQNNMICNNGHVQNSGLGLRTWATLSSNCINAIDGDLEDHHDFRIGI